MWVVNEEVVFRFPRLATRRARVDVEARVVAALRASSRLRGIVPAIEHVSPHGYSGQRLVLGVDGETRRPPRAAWPLLADDVRAALAAVHSTPAPAGLDERPLPLAGIIDWADACVSHPVRDLAGIVLWLGPEFTRLVDERDATAAVFYARCSAVADAARHARGEWNAPPVHEHLKWVMSRVRPTR